MAKKVPPTKELLEKRRLEQAKRRRAAESAAKLAALSPGARKIHDARQAIKQATLNQRTETQRHEQKARRDEYARQLDEARKRQEDQRKAEREASLRRAASVLTATQAPADDTTPKRPAKRVRFEDDVARTPGPDGKECRLAVAPSVQQVRTDFRFACSEARLPTIEGLGTMATASVVYADALVGIGSWGEGAGTWARPARWIPLIEKLNRTYNALPAGREERQALGMKVRNGEYNVVFFPGEATDLEIELPPFVDASGRALRNDEVVIRMTRPDAAEQHNGDPFFRYKKFEAMCREFYYTLHGAVHGFAPPCLAATLFPAIRITTDDGKQHNLYGALYVMRKAEKDLNGVLDEQTARLREQNRGPNGVQQQLYTEALRKAGRKAVLWLLPVLCRQAKLGALSFDAKPANYVAGSDAKPYAIDFDASMYTVAANAPQEWPAALLLLLSLLTAHVRLYSAPALADGWAQALRPLILELCGPARCAAWMFDARLCGRKFQEIIGDDDEALRKRLEMMTQIYFVKVTGTGGATFRPQMGAGAPKLMEQLLRYCLHGTVTAQDHELARALGSVHAQPLLGAQAKPWG